MAINLETAKALAIDVPPPPLALADEVIEYRVRDFRFGSWAAVRHYAHRLPQHLTIDDASF